MDGNGMFVDGDGVVLQHRIAVDELRFLEGVGEGGRGDGGGGRVGFLA